MEQGFRISPKSRVRGNKRKTEEGKALTITNAQYLGGHTLLLDFSNNKQRVIDFKFLFKKFLKGDYSKYYLLPNFKKFQVEDGNISWGENEEVIFPVSFLFTCRYGKTEKDEVIYVL